MSSVDLNPKDDPFILEMYKYAYPLSSDTTLIQLINLEYNDVLSKLNTLKLAADNGFNPELMKIIKERMNAKASEIWNIISGEKDDK